MRRGDGRPTVGAVTASRSRADARAADAAVYSITAAATPHSDDLNARMGKYLVSMAIRTVCVILAVVVSGWLRWLFITGAVVLPYVAVLLANASHSRRGPGATPVTAQLHAEGLGPAPQSRVIRVEDASVVDVGAEDDDSPRADPGQPGAGQPDAGQPDAGQPDAGEGAARGPRIYEATADDIIAEVIGDWPPREPVGADQRSGA